MILGMTRQEVKSALHLDSIIHGFEPEMIYPSDSVTGEPTAPEATRDHKADELSWQVSEPVGRGGQLMVEVATRMGRPPTDLSIRCHLGFVIDDRLSKIECWMPDFQPVDIRTWLAEQNGEPKQVEKPASPLVVDGEVIAAEPIVALVWQRSDAMMELEGFTVLRIVSNAHVTYVEKMQKRVDAAYELAVAGKQSATGAP